VVRDVRGGYSKYKQSLSSPEDSLVDDEADNQTEESANIPTKLSYMDQREFDAIGPQIQQLEKRKDQINGLFEDTSTPHDELASLGKEMNHLLEQIQALEERRYELLSSIET
jgi:ATP-binding cassette subfamily F protein uup